MKVLSIDFGLKRIGTAIGSTESGIAFAREVFVNDEKIFDRLREFIEREEVEMILVGNPIQADGAVGDIHDQLEEFLDELDHITDVSVELYDERYTTKIAREKLREVGLNAKEQKGQIDAFAAQVMLQEWLDLQ